MAELSSTNQLRAVNPTVPTLVNVMSRIHGRGNKDTEVALAKLLRSHGIIGWRRQQKLRLEGQKRRAGPSRPTNVGIDFLFPKERIAIFVDGCFWHGCPIHSKPAKWLKKSSMGEGQKSGVRIQNSVVRERCGNSYQPSVVSGQSKTDKTLLTTENRQLRTGKQFWREKLAANMARDRFVNRELRKQGWKVVRIWEHELGAGGRSQKSEFRSQKTVEKIRRALNPSTSSGQAPESRPERGFGYAHHRRGRRPTPAEGAHAAPPRIATLRTPA